MLNSNHIFYHLFLFVFIVFINEVNAQDPDPPLITHISVNQSSQQVEINWINSVNQVVGYIIYFQDISGLWIPLDTVQGILNTSYTTSNANPQTKIETYSVVAFDALGNNSVRSESHSTILVDYDHSECDTSVFLSWNKYENMVGITSYQLKIQKKEVVSGLVISTDSVSLSLADTSFNYLIDYSSQYVFWVEALSTSSYKAKSNLKRMFTTNVELPTFCYINRVSVVGENNIEVSAITNSSDIELIKIYRSYVPNGFQFYVGKAIANQDNEFVFNDFLVLPQRNEYYYTARPVDKCGKDYILPKFENSLDTSEARNLQLKAIETNSSKMSVLCGQYDFFLQPSRLELWKSVNGEEQFLRDVLPNAAEEVSVANDYGQVCLYLVAKEQNTNVINLKDYVISNEVCISKVPKFFIPNSFSPNGDGKNDFWEVFVYKTSSVTSFSLNILNRWGQAIYSTNSLDGGWDGKINNAPVTEGIYFYDVIINYSDNQIERQTGSLTLIR